MDHTDEPHNQPAHTGTRVCQTCVCPCVPCPGSVLEWISQISSLRSCRNSVQYRVLFRRNSSVNSSSQCSMRESFRRVDADSRPFCARLGTRVANARCTHHSALGHSTLGQIRMFASPLPPAATDMLLKAAAEQAAAEKAAAEKAVADRPPSAPKLGLNNWLPSSSGVPPRMSQRPSFGPYSSSMTTRTRMAN